ncbi:MAG: zinc-ribbon domain-containing protein, partial [Clostridia bacterium]|nr:zinc-ribbon domain-containing protein [Clostridia bacterium]
MEFRLCGNGHIFAGEPTQPCPICRATVSRPLPPEQTPVCFNCGAPLVAGEAFCRNCGAPASGPAPAPAPAPGQGP